MVHANTRPRRVNVMVADGLVPKWHQDISKHHDDLGRSAHVKSVQVMSPRSGLTVLKWPRTDHFISYDFGIHYLVSVSRSRFDVTCDVRSWHTWVSILHVVVKIYVCVTWGLLYVIHTGVAFWLAPNINHHNDCVLLEVTRKHRITWLLLWYGRSVGG